MPVRKGLSKKLAQNVIVKSNGVMSVGLNSITKSYKSRILGGIVHCIRERSNTDNLDRCAIGLEGSKFECGVTGHQFPEHPGKSRFCAGSRPYPIFLFRDRFHSKSLRS